MEACNPLSSASDVALNDIAQQQPARLVVVPRSADDRYGAWIEQGLQIEHSMWPSRHSAHTVGRRALWPAPHRLIPS
jgi:hypothetical protein